MLKRFLFDNRGAAGSEYALIFAITLLCVAGAAMFLGGKASTSIRQVAESITGKVVEIARDHIGT